MRLKPIDSFSDVAPELRERGGCLIQRDGVHARIPVPGHDPLADENGYPAGMEKKTVPVLHDEAAFAEGGDLFVERAGQLHGPDIVPEGGIVALGGGVVKDQEIPYPVIFQGHDAVELRNVCGVQRPLREKLQKRRNPLLNQVDGCRLQRLEEATGKTDGDHVSNPLLAALARPEAQLVWLTQRRFIQTGEELILCGLIIEEGRRIDMTVSNAVLEGDPPFPSCRQRSGAGVGEWRGGALRGNGNRPVAWQPARPVFIGYPEGPLDQQGAEAGAVYEEVTADLPLVTKVERRDMAGLGVLGNGRDFSFHAHHASLLADLSEIPGI